MTLGERIAAKRSEHRLSQSDLAEKLDVSRQSISKWETDASVPELEKLVKMSEIFGLTLDQLVRGTEEQPASEAEHIPEPPVSQSAPARSSVTLRQIVGVALIALAVLVGVLVAFLTGQVLEAFLLTVPALLLGLPCVLFPRTPLWYWWVLYGTALWLVPKATGMSVYHPAMAILGLVLLAVTVQRLWKTYKK